MLNIEGTVPDESVRRSAFDVRCSMF